ncbi:hypothetical protein NDU88_008536 [Pleurodeles waltl]|uniref:Uncharacterized protein n=1 Tax=Pleurodeles waltl TaxID=8319 RepID=A0AAV7RSN7_PLEWA|nr:hypothetical protein NDU88_008536 [Pleurodeles waltl]
MSPRAPTRERLSRHVEEWALAKKRLVRDDTVEEGCSERAEVLQELLRPVTESDSDTDPEQRLNEQLSRGHSLPGQPLPSTDDSW